MSYSTVSAEGWIILSIYPCNNNNLILVTVGEQNSTESPNKITTGGIIGISIGAAFFIIILIVIIITISNLRGRNNSESVRKSSEGYDSRFMSQNVLLLSQSFFFKFYSLSYVSNIF